MTSHKPIFSAYEKFVIFTLALIQFTIIADFMLLSPLGAILMPEMRISTSQFGLVVSVYAFSAGVSGLLAAGFADRVDRKKMLIFFYCGFLLGSLFCGIADSYQALLLARIVTGFFGGVVGSISFAIITDTFRMEVRGRVMGFIQMAFAASQIMGIPFGLYLATRIDWHAPFLAVAAMATAITILIAIRLKPVTEHLQAATDKSAFLHLWHTASNFSYIRGFVAMMMLSVGGFLIMPFSSTFIVNNILIPEENLSLIFFVIGLVSIATSPVIGIICDRLGKYPVFVFGSLLSMALVVVYTHLGPNPVWIVILTNSILWIGVSSRMISSSALTSGIPEIKDRGAYMGINSSIQQISGGVASAISGMIVYQPSPDHPLQHYDIVGYLTVGTMSLTMIMMYFIDRQVSRNRSQSPDS